MNQAPVGREFILGGRAILTMVGKSARFTFKVRRADPTEKNPNPDLYFVSVMTGTDNEGGYSYLGVLNTGTGAVHPSRGSKLPESHPAFVAARWAFPKVWATGGIPGGQVLHAGRCGRCARLLTDPDSIRSGFGPECRKLIGKPISKADVAEDYPGAGSPQNHRLGGSGGAVKEQRTRIPGWHGARTARLMCGGTVKRDVAAPGKSAWPQGGKLTARGQVTAAR